MKAILTTARLNKNLLRNHFHQSSVSSARILATDGVDENCVKIFQRHGHEVDLLKTLPESELCQVIGNYDGLVVRSATKVTKKVLESAAVTKQLRVVGRAGVGVDNIDVPIATKFGIMVMNTPDGNTISTAQLAVSLICSLARDIPGADSSIKAGKWDRKSFMGSELAGKTLGIIGCGRIGQVVAQCAHSLGMTVLGYDPGVFVSASETTQSAISRVLTLDEIWSRSDFITVHTPLTPETSNLLNDTTISKCKRGVRIINCARGGIVDEAALLRALEDGRVGGAALDVYTSEPPKAHLAPLLAHPKLICTPHLGASTDEAQVNVAKDVAEQMCALFAYQSGLPGSEDYSFTGVMNVPYLAASSQPHVKPFMTLTETIGMVLAQLQGSLVLSLELKTWGGRDVNITNKTTRQLLQAMLLKGFISRNDATASLPVDLISAPQIAKDCDLESNISSESPIGYSSSPYWNMVSVTAKRSDGTSTCITGSVFGDIPHITQIDEYRDLFAFKLSTEGKHVLTFRNEDRPGAISEVLGVLAANSINVASVNVARVTTNGLLSSDSIPALCFMALDDDIPEPALAQLQASSSLKQVSMIRL